MGDSTARGVLNGKVGTGMCGPDRVLFRPLRLNNNPFFHLKIGLDIGRVFEKCIIFDEFFLWFTLGCQKVLMHPNLHVKSTDCFKKKKGGVLQETNGYTKVANLRLLWFSYRVVVETSSRTSVPNSKLSTTPGFHGYSHYTFLRPFTFQGLWIKCQ